VIFGRQESYLGCSDRSSVGYVPGVSPTPDASARGDGVGDAIGWPGVGGDSIGYAE
jgi:hypothetical protein